MISQHIHYIFVEGEVYPSSEREIIFLYSQDICPFKSSFWYFTNRTGHNLLTDNTLKKITQDELARCSAFVSDRNAKLAGHVQNMVGQCPVTHSYFRHGGHIIFY